MKNPSEDCDGFTMLTAALLTILGVRVLIATVATEPDDPSRWSHVFLVAIVNGQVKPLDTSHGTAPGWMVPRSRINRWQTWTLDGRPADVQIPSFQGLHAYTVFPGLGQVRGRRVLRAPLVLVKRGRGFGRVRGLGQADCWCDDGSDASSGVCDDGSAPECGTDTTSTAIPACMPTTFSGPLAPGQSYCVNGVTPVSPVDTPQLACSDSGGAWNGTGCVMPGAATVVSPCPAGQTYSGLSCSGGASPNYASMVSAIANAASADIRAVVQQPSALLSAQTWANLVGYLPIIGIAVLGVVVLSEFAGGKK
jgi:hypothetical protein